MWDDFEDMRRFRREMQKLWENLPGFQFREPLSDLKETDKDVIAVIELPGVDKNDIQLNVTENNLEVKVEKKSDTHIEKEGYIRSERSYKGFYRSMSLPCKIVPEQVKANYKNGILEVTMPKAEKKKVKKVEVE